MTQTIDKTTGATFAEDVLTAERPVLVDFYADWCAPCKQLQPILEEVASELDERLSVVKVDIEQERELAGRFGIRSIPTLMLFEGGAAAVTMIGMTSKDQLLNKLTPHV